MNPRQTPKRDGAAVLVLVVMFAIITAMLGVWAKSIMEQQRQTRVRGHAAQAQWLAESGLRRAVARRTADSDYSGETWLIAPDALSGRYGGRVEIAIERSPDRQDRRRITARAAYPDVPVHRVQKSIWIEVPK